MSEFRATDYVAHIRQACTEALAFVDGMSKEQFLLDLRTQKAVMMSLLTWVRPRPS